MYSSRDNIIIFLNEKYILYTKKNIRYSFTIALNQQLKERKETTTYYNDGNNHSKINYNFYFIKLTPFIFFFLYFNLRKQASCINVKFLFILLNYFILF